MLKYGHIEEIRGEIAHRIIADESINSIKFYQSAHKTPCLNFEYSYKTNGQINVF